MDYRKTVHLPQTDFPMRAQLPTREPEFEARWEERNLYAAIRAARHGRPRWTFHDGPPYASGRAHMGTALNKALKDIIVRTRTLDGFDAPYIPGWDTHGLPIERRVVEETGMSIHKDGALPIRAKCREFALANIAAMTAQFKRMGVLANWDEPYRTLNPGYEGAEVRVFGEMARKGYIYKGLRPVYWCPECETALAEAEIEYQEKVSPSIWVAFPVEDGRGLLPAGTRLAIWTTTPWTMPGNLAIALHPDVEYVLVETPGGALVAARERLQATLEAAGWADANGADAAEGARVLKAFTGRELEGVTYRHPLYDRVSPVILGEHVTTEEGTGLVHTAPGHGHEDFAVGRRYNLEVLVPIDAAGHLTAAAGPFEGLSVDEANQRIPEALQQAGALLGRGEIRHQYAHCWRSHTPIIYRATEQWFADLGKIRPQALSAAADVEWIPAWGGQTMRGMVADRGDWCLSRQRVWGLPIPVFYCRACGEALLTDASVNAVADLFAREGSDAWWQREAAEILPAETACETCGGRDFRKETDIFDVWFDSGSSHAAVLARRPELDDPANLYLEGYDQYRGWFQSSLLTSAATRGRAPYRQVLTHGWVLGADGRQMHKSWGNAVSPEEVLEQYGADVFRLWVTSTDYTADVRIGPSILDQAAEAYRKIRNTLRFLLGNLHGYHPAADGVAPEALPPLDRWAVARTAEVQAALRRAYTGYEFRDAYNLIHHFCVNELSSFYLNARKDTLYCAALDDDERRAARSALWLIARALVSWIAPIMPHTAEEVWDHLPKEAGAPWSVHMSEWFPLPGEPEGGTAGRPAAVEALLQVRDDVLRQIEEARTAGRLKGASSAVVTIAAEDGEQRRLLADWGEAGMAQALGVAEVRLTEVDSGRISVAPSGYNKCARCWRYVADVGADAAHPDLCGRCADVLARWAPAE